MVILCHAKHLLSIKTKKNLKKFFCFIVDYSFLKKCAKTFEKNPPKHDCAHIFKLLRWLTHLCMWNPVPGVAVAAAGRSPAWQLGPGVKEDEEKIQILSTGSLFSKQPCFRFIPSLRFLWKGLPLRDIKATTRVALIPRRGHPPVLIPRPVRVGWLQWPSGRHHPDKGERHR